MSTTLTVMPVISSLSVTYVLDNFRGEWPRNFNIKLVLDLTPPLENC